MHPLDFLGFAAATAVLAGFCMNSIQNLRRLALASNVLFVLYGLLAHIYPVLLLHIILMPINTMKLCQIWHQANCEDANTGKREALAIPGNDLASAIDAGLRRRAHPKNDPPNSAPRMG